MANNKKYSQTKTNQSMHTSALKRPGVRQRSNLARPRPFRATRVDEAAEKAQRIKWFLKWLLFLPLSVYVVIWFLLLMYELLSI
jgi:Flp pilus assembly protein TadB